MAKNKISEEDTEYWNADGLAKRCKRYFVLSEWNKYLFCADLGHGLEYNCSEYYRPIVLGYLLAQAAKMGCEEALPILLALGAEVDFVFEKKHTAMYYAAEGGHRECVRILKKHGAKLQYRVPYNGTIDCVQVAKNSGYKI